MYIEYEYGMKNETSRIRLCLEKLVKKKFLANKIQRNIFQLHYHNVTAFWSNNSDLKYHISCNQIFLNR